MAHVISTPNTGLGLSARVSRYVDDVKRAWALNREYKRTYAELDGLSNHELADIGVRRCDIADIARQHVYGQ
ncbi:DUF1127 domain-containing protein [Cribrihabitans neustonicus]|uniref:DUF1127 domain-containing protein n=1 Tax=Cribrihabitans neustonicus TaxID=1429085 RepID=UPI003B5AF6BE